jgi:hypothetical protein
MNAKDKKAETDRERFERDLAALMAVPKADVAALEAERQKREPAAKKQH